VEIIDQPKEKANIEILYWKTYVKFMLNLEYTYLFIALECSLWNY